MTQKNLNLLYFVFTFASRYLIKHWLFLILSYLCALCSFTVWSLLSKSIKQQWEIAKRQDSSFKHKGGACLLMADPFRSYPQVNYVTVHVTFQGDFTLFNINFHKMSSHRSRNIFKCGKNNASFKSLLTLCCHLVLVNRPNSLRLRKNKGVFEYLYAVSWRHKVMYQKSDISIKCLSAWQKCVHSM